MLFPFVPGSGELTFTLSIAIFLPPLPLGPWRGVALRGSCGVWFEKYYIFYSLFTSYKPLRRLCVAVCEVCVRVGAGALPASGEYSIDLNFSCGENPRCIDHARTRRQIMLHGPTCAMGYVISLISHFQDSKRWPLPLMSLP